MSSMHCRGDGLCIGFEESKMTLDRQWTVTAAVLLGGSLSRVSKSEQSEWLVQSYLQDLRTDFQ